MCSLGQAWVCIFLSLCSQGWFETDVNPQTHTKPSEDRRGRGHGWYLGRNRVCDNPGHLAVLLLFSIIIIIIIFKRESGCVHPTQSCIGHGPMHQDVT